MLPFKACPLGLTHQLVYILYSPRESRHSTDLNVQQKNRNTYSQTSPPTRTRSQRELVCWFTHNSTHWVWHPICIVIGTYIHSTVNANWELGSSKQALGGDWSCPLCSRSGVQMDQNLWSYNDWKGYSPEDLSIFPNINSALRCHTLPYVAISNCPTHQIPHSFKTMNAPFPYFTEFFLYKMNIDVPVGIGARSPTWPQPISWWLQ